MFTDNDKAELARLMQKRRRSKNTKTRDAMLRWSKSPAGKAARKRYLQSPGGKEATARRRELGTEAYARKMADLSESARTAPNGNCEWTNKDQTKLMLMHDAGMTAREIAAKLGRSIRGIERMRERLKKANA